MLRLGIALVTAGKILNQTSESAGGIAGVYQRHNYLDELRAALEAWRGFLDRLAGQPLRLLRPGEKMR